MQNRSSWAILAICVGSLAFLPACRLTDMTLWRPLSEHRTGDCSVEYVWDVAYFHGPHLDKTRHKLDLFLPKGRTDFPVVMLVHGGAWLVGDNRCCGLYSSVGESLASQGIGVVMPNYRLSPTIKHPEHIRDIARAFAWTHANIARHGGDPNQLFLVGHSAGGHLVSLLATDEQYLKAEGRSINDIRGVVGLSGVYSIPPGKTDVHLFGSSPDSLKLAAIAPLRGESDPQRKRMFDGPGLPISLNIFGPAFGDSEAARRAASPVAHVRPGLPPFLLMAAENDLPLLPDMAEEMHRTLLANRCQSQFIRVERRNHNTIMFQAANRDDPVSQAIMQFVRENSGTSGIETK